MVHSAHIACVVGARPNYMKMAPALKVLKSFSNLRVTLIHTGQHYDPVMSDNFFFELGIGAPDYRLDVGPSTQLAQIAKVIERIEPVLQADRPNVVVVAGDVNSTLAAALAAVKLAIPVAHIEAGLRSFNRKMPEEINRILVDQIATILYTTEKSAHKNLFNEGIDKEKIVFVGNLMIDTLFSSLDKAIAATDQIREGFGLEQASRVAESYAVLTLHRPSNVDDPTTLRAILDAITTIAADIPIIFPVHPRTRSKIDHLRRDFANRAPGVLMTPPVSYLQMLGLIKQARFVLTDSGGLQEETTALNIPCFTLREDTERPITVEEGTNTIVGVDPQRIVAESQLALCGNGKRGKVPDGWDGAAAKRLAQHLLRWLDEN